MSERASLLELLRLLAAAGLINGKVVVRDGDDDSHAHVPLDVNAPRRPRHLVSV
jgi:hypothetical protein